MKLLKRICLDNQGATAIEYALIAGLIAMAIIGGATAVGTQLDSGFDNMATELAPAP